MNDKLTRRQFIRDSAIAGAAIGAGIGLSNNASAKDTSKILNYNPDMQYRCEAYAIFRQRYHLSIQDFLMEYLY